MVIMPVYHDIGSRVSVSYWAGHEVEMFEDRNKEFSG